MSKCNKTRVIKGDDRGVEPKLIIKWDRGATEDKIWVIWFFERSLNRWQRCRSVAAKWIQNGWPMLSCVRRGSSEHIQMCTKSQGMKIFVV